MLTAGAVLRLAKYGRGPASRIFLGPAAMLVYAVNLEPNSCACTIAAQLRKGDLLTQATKRRGVVGPVGRQLSRVVLRARRHFVCQ
jgi:hypothetical protein